MKRKSIFIALSVLFFSLFSCGEKNNYTYDLRSDKIALPVPYSITYLNENDEILELNGENLDYFYNTYLKDLVFGEIEFAFITDMEMTYYFETDDPGYIDRPITLYLGNFNRLSLNGKFWGFYHGYMSLDKVPSSSMYNYLMEKGVKNV